MRPGIGSKIIGLMMIPVLIVLLPILLLFAMLSMRKLAKNIPNPQRPPVFVDDDNVITVPAIEKK
jgi:hypothetical protein